MKTYLGMGSNCFTGSQIVDVLLERPDYRVIGVSRSPEYKDIFLPYTRHRTPAFQSHQINMVTEFDRLVELMERTQPGVVINMAALSEVALSHVRPAEYFETNALVTVKLANDLHAWPCQRPSVVTLRGPIYARC